MGIPTIPGDDSVTGVAPDGVTKPGVSQQGFDMGNEPGDIGGGQ